MLPAEAFAHLLETQFDPKRLASMREFFPEAVDEFAKILKELL